MKQALLFAGAITLFLAAAGLPGGEPVARWLGALVFYLLAALLIVWLFVRKQVPRPSIWSPWLFVVAAGIALLGRFNQ